MERQICIRAMANIDQINNCKRKILEKNNSISFISKMLGLAGNEIRFKILYLLFLEKELCVCDLSDILNMNVSAISQHLRKLKDGNIVNVRREGQTYYYYLLNDDFNILNSIFNTIQRNNQNNKVNIKTIIK